MGRWVVGIVGFLVLVFGALCLNYTYGEGIEHHRQVAEKHGLPPPSRSIFYLGIACVALGAGTTGFAIGSRRASGAGSPR